MRRSEIIRPAFTTRQTAATYDFIAGHRRTLTLAEFADGQRDPRDICVRHDIDHDLSWSEQWAAYEASRGVRSTYFVLPTAPYWVEARDRVLAIASHGHEIGVHNDALCAALGDVRLAIEMLRAAADRMRGWGIEVVGLADHGGAPYSNLSLWTTYGHVPADASFSYEAYALHKQGSNYISDNRGILRAPLEDVPGRQTHMLIHPGHWSLP